MTRRVSKYGPRRINRYTPAMAYSVEVIHGAPLEVDFGAPAVAAVANILSAQSINVALDTNTFLQDNTDPVVVATQADFPYGPGFGRCLQIVLSGAGTPTVVIYGRDYLGQPMREQFTGAGAAAVIGNKAFKYIDRITSTLVAATTLSVGTTDKLGLPYCMSNILSEELDGVRVATLGTLVTPSRVDPQTATTTDPRGTYDPQSTLNGTARLKAFLLPDPSLNAAGNGGLHGLAHFFA